MVEFASGAEGSKCAVLSERHVEGFISQLDPRTVLCIFPLALTYVFLFSSKMVQDFYFLFFLFLALKSLKRNAFVMKWLVVLAIVHAPLGFIQHSSFQYWFVALSVRKSCMIFSTGVILFSSVSVGDVVNVMKKMKLHKNIIIPVAICFRFVPTLVHETGMIRDALRVRKLYSIKSILRHPLVTFETFLCALLFRMFALGEELNFSLATRGINFSGNVFYCAKDFSYRDVFFLIVTCLYLYCIFNLPALELVC